MNDIKRYTLHVHASGSWLEEDPDGFYVAGDDYDALAERLKAAEAKVTPLGQIDPALTYKALQSLDAQHKALQAESNKLAEENDKLRQLLAQKVMDDTLLSDINRTDNGLILGMEGGACQILADAFGQQLLESGAENYIEVLFESSRHPELGQIVVTVKKETGETPHQLRAKAELERDILKAECLTYMQEIMRLNGVDGERRELYTHESGGEYSLLGMASPAGALRVTQGASGVLVYRDLSSGSLYYRDPGCFRQRMKRLPAGGEA